MSINPVALERASFIRDMEFTRNNIKDSIIQEAMESDSVKKMVPGSYEDDITDKELEDAIRQIPDDDEERNEEINRIIKTNENLDIDGIIGLDNDDDFSDYESEEE